jgi:predicted transposase/invertase (TIGR01784 family)
MDSKYDKILKENLEEIFLPLCKKLLNLEFEEAEEIPDDLQATRELRPDFLKRVRHEDTAKDFILQMEFQSADDYEMPKRMLDYYGMLYRKYELPIHQQVFYLGKGKSRMSNSIRHDNLKFNYHIVDFNKIAPEHFLNSEIPEEMILTILTDFKAEEATDLIGKILLKIDQLKKGTFYKQRIVRQLEVISGLRNLQPIIATLIPKIMALDYDIRKDLRYQQGVETGKIEGKLEEKIEMISALLKKGKLSMEEIAETAEVTLDYVKKIAEAL